MVRTIAPFFSVSLSIACTASLAVSCGADPAKDKPTTPKEDPTHDESPDPAPTSEPEPQPRASTEKRPLPVGDDYVMSHRDCEALASSYQRAWLNDELEKIAGQDTTPAARADLEKSAKQGGESWLSSCRGIVGSPQMRDNLQCALKAKSIERFDKCMAGQG